MATERAPRPGILWARPTVVNPELSDEEWYHWQNEVMLPQFLHATGYKNGDGAEAPTLLMRYLNADKNADEGWRDLSLIVCPDLNWYGNNDRWEKMPCWSSDITPRIGPVKDSIKSYLRSYELLDFHNSPHRVDRGSRLVCYEEDPAPGTEIEFQNWYIQDHVCELEGLRGLQFVARYTYTEPTSPANQTIETDVPRYLTLYQFADENYDRAGLEAFRSTKRAKAFLDKLTHSHRTEWNMALDAENVEANLRRQAKFRARVARPLGPSKG